MPEFSVNKFWRELPVERVAVWPVLYMVASSSALLSDSDTGLRYFDESWDSLKTYLGMASLLRILFHSVRPINWRMLIGSP